MTILREFRPQIRSLRDATPALVAAEAQRLGDETARRCRHVVTENARVLATVDALRARDFVTAGSLLRASHASLRDDYEVSCAELDILVDIATDLPGVFGARMTGGGFGGCTINLVAPAAVADVSRELVQRYERSTGLHAEIYVCTAAAGAGALRT